MWLVVTGGKSRWRFTSGGCFGKCGKQAELTKEKLTLKKARKIFRLYGAGNAEPGFRKVKLLVCAPAFFTVRQIVWKISSKRTDKNLGDKHQKIPSDKLFAEEQGNNRTDPEKNSERNLRLHIFILLTRNQKDSNNRAGKCAKKNRK